MAIGYRAAAGSGGGVPAPHRLVEALMALPDVVAVRVNGDATAVYRVDVEAATAAAAAELAGLPAIETGDTLGLEVEIASVTAVADAERIAAFLARMAARG